MKPSANPIGEADASFRAAPLTSVTLDTRTTRIGMNRLNTLLLVFSLVGVVGCGASDRNAPPRQVAPPAEAGSQAAQKAPPTAAPPPATAPQQPPMRQQSEWYSGGTLHDAKMSAWSRSSYTNRLATSSDFVARLMQLDGMKLPPVDQLKPVAEGMERCISETNSGGVADSQDVTTVAAACWILMKQS